MSGKRRLSRRCALGLHAWTKLQWPARRCRRCGTANLGNLQDTSQ